MSFSPTTQSPNNSGKSASTSNECYICGEETEELEYDYIYEGEYICVTCMQAQEMEESLYDPEESPYDSEESSYDLEESVFDSQEDEYGCEACLQLREMHQLPYNSEESGYTSEEDEYICDGCKQKQILEE